MKLLNQGRITQIKHFNIQRVYPFIKQINNITYVGINDSLYVLDRNLKLKLIYKSSSVINDVVYFNQQFLILQNDNIIYNYSQKQKYTNINYSGMFFVFNSKLYLIFNAIIELDVNKNSIKVNTVIHDHYFFIKTKFNTNNFLFEEPKFDINGFNLYFF